MKRIGVNRFMAKKLSRTDVHLALFQGALESKVKESHPLHATNIIY
jgi:hypothetical protein